MKEQYSDSLNSAESTNTEVWSTKMRSTSSTSDMGTCEPLLFQVGFDFLDLFLVGIDFWDLFLEFLETNVMFLVCGNQTYYQKFNDMAAT